MKILENIRKAWNAFINGENSPQKEVDTTVADKRAEKLDDLLQRSNEGGANVYNDAEDQVEAEAEGLAGNAKIAEFEPGRVESSEQAAESRGNEADEPETFVDDAHDNDSEFIAGDHPDHECHVSVNITSEDRRKPGRLRVCKGDICDILEPGTDLAFYGYLGDLVTVEVVE